MAIRLDLPSIGRIPQNTSENEILKIEIVHNPPLTLVGREKACTECEDEKKRPQEDPASGDRVSLSPGALSLAEDAREKTAAEGEGAENSSAKDENKSTAPRPEAELSEEEKRQLDQLKTRDREVRAHEQAHKAAAGPYAKGPPAYEFQTGPDGHPYAVGGEVKIDTAPIPGNPRATLVKAQTIKRAAHAPKNPSAQDRQVAAQAAQMEAQARRELSEQRREESAVESRESTAGSAVGGSFSGVSREKTASAAPAAKPLDTPAGSSGAENQNEVHPNRFARRVIENFQTGSSHSAGTHLDRYS